MVRSTETDVTDSRPSVVASKADLGEKMRRSAAWRLGVFLLLCCLLVTASTWGSDLRLLEGKAVVREIAAEEAHVYRIELAAGQAWRLTVEQLGVDVTIGLTAPDGKLALTVDSPLDRQGTETLAVVPAENQLGHDTMMA